MSSIWTVLLVACACVAVAEGSQQMAFSGYAALPALRRSARSSMSGLRMVAVPRRLSKVEVEPEVCRMPECADPDPNVRQEYFGAAIGDTVRINWAAKAEDGESVGRSGSSSLGSKFGQGKLPTRLIKDEFCLGGKDVHTAIHTAMIGLLPGDSRDVRLPAAECFGPRDEEVVYTVTKSMLRPPVPTDMPVPLGTTFKINGGMEARVTEVDGEYVVLDGNREHAGKDLLFSCTVMEIIGNQCGNGIEELEFDCDF